MLKKTIKFDDKRHDRLFKKYHHDKDSLVNESFKVISEVLVESGLAEDCHIGNNKGITDCDGLYYDICDVDDQNRYKFVFKFILRDGSFYLKFGYNGGVSGKIHKFLNRNKKKILKKFGEGFLKRLDEFQSFVPTFNQSLREFYEFRNAG